MTTPDRIVLSASRRTDIPAFYMDWFMDRVARGDFEVVNPYNGRIRRVPAGVDRVRTIVFWSKNFQPFLDGRYGEKLVRAGYHLFFNFTVNSTDPLLEPNLPPLAQRLAQLAELAGRFGPRRLHWRFDPICFYALDGVRHDNLTDFEKIADAAARAGIPTCVTSFMDFYKKIERRAAAIPGFSFIDPEQESKRGIVHRMENYLQAGGMALRLCCEKALLAALPADSTVAAASCVPGDLLARLDGPGICLHKDTGQRRAAGCGCTISRDIGDYRRHPCYHNCLFCYASPAAGSTARSGRPVEEG